MFAGLARHALHCDDALNCVGCRQGKASFGDAGVFVEKYVTRARHIEIQIFGNGQGGIVALGERECSIQRRHQKVVEESPVTICRCTLS